MIKIAIKQAGEMVEYGGITYRTPVNVYIEDGDLETFSSQLKLKLISEYDIISGLTKEDVPVKATFSGNPGSRKVRKSESSIIMPLKIGKR